MRSGAGNWPLIYSQKYGQNKKVKKVQNKKLTCSQIGKWNKPKNWIQTWKKNYKNVLGFQSEVKSFNLNVFAHFEHRRDFKIKFFKISTIMKKMSLTKRITILKFHQSNSNNCFYESIAWTLSNSFLKLLFSFQFFNIFSLYSIFSLEIADFNFNFNDVYT